MRWKKSVAVVPAAMLLAVAACGGGSSSSTDGGGASAPQTSQSIGGGDAGGGQDPNAAGPADPVPGAKPGGDVTVLTANAPTTFDPTRAYYTDSTAILSDLVIRSLTQYKYDPKTGQEILVPDLATDLGTANADNTQWTFTLKDGIKYSDGTPVTAEDVAYAVKRSFAVQELPEGPTYNLTFFKDGDKYKGPFKDGDKYSGVSVKGNSITMYMRRPFPDLPYLMSFPQFSPIPEAKDNVNSYGLKPLATGPYKFESYKPGAELKLVKNDQWDPNSDPVRHQYVNSWDFKFTQDSSTLDNTVINDSGAAQTTLTYDNLLAPDYATAVQKGAKDRVVTGTQPCTYLWYLDYRKIKELQVRQAIGWAYPYVDAFKTAGEIVGLTRIPGTTILPPGTDGRIDNGTSLAGQDGKTTDPAKSKQLLAAAGYKPGEYELKFLFAADDPTSKQVMEKVKAGLEAGGFKVSPVPSTLDQIRADRVDYGVDINIRSSGWCSDWPNGASWFPAQWRGDQVGLEGMPNTAQFKEPKADALQNKILDTLSGSQENNAWGKFDVFMEHTYYPAVVLGYGGVLTMHGSKIGGMENDNVRGMPTFTQMYVVS